jgi:hypothetical protein
VASTCCCCCVSVFVVPAVNDLSRASFMPVGAGHLCKISYPSFPSRTIKSIE